LCDRRGNPVDALNAITGSNKPIIWILRLFKNDREPDNLRREFGSSKYFGIIPVPNSFFQDDL
jgi:hypothetical protein